MTKDEALKLVLEFIERVNKDGWILADFEPQMYEAITAIKAALANEALERMAENARELGLDYEPVQKVTLGRNEALRVTAEGEFIWHPEADAMIEHGDFTSNPAMRFILKELRKRQQPAALEAKDEPVAWRHTKIDGVAVPHRPADLDKHPERWEALYKTPPPCPTCEALARTVMLDQTSHDTTPPQRTWVGLTEDEIVLISADCAATHQHTDIHFAKAIENKLRELNT
jgi:hypothetical protein